MAKRTLEYGREESGRDLNKKSAKRDSAGGGFLSRDEAAYILPMATFLLFVFIGGKWQSIYPLTYVARVAIVAGTLFYFRRDYTRLTWNNWELGLLVGIVGIFQWVGMQLWLQNHIDFFKPSPDVFDPTKVFSTPTMLWSFIAVRMIGAVLVVPIMEELFWRDWLWRTTIAPNDFKLAKVGEWDWKAFALVTILFATVHGNWWLTAIVWAAMVAALLVYTKSIGACIIAHATTNLLLALWVLWTWKYHPDQPAWSFW